jgi:hypothetical protein
MYGVNRQSHKFNKIMKYSYIRIHMRYIFQCTISKCTISDMYKQHTYTNEYINALLISGLYNSSGFEISLTPLLRPCYFKQKQLFILKLKHAINQNNTYNCVFTQKYYI